MQEFHEIVENTRKIFDERTKVRDQALVQARQLTRLSALTIRAIHRSEIDEAHELLSEAHVQVLNMQRDLAAYPDLYYAGYTQDAIKEFAEANLTCALIENRRLPRPEDLGIEYATYVNGLAETIGELRRRCLDILRQGYSQEAERLLTAMDEIYNFLVTMDYPDAITNGLRRQTDLVRGIIERTRADLTLEPARAAPAGSAAEVFREVPGDARGVEGKDNGLLLGPCLRINIYRGFFDEEKQRLMLTLFRFNKTGYFDKPPRIQVSPSRQSPVMGRFRRGGYRSAVLSVRRHVRLLAGVGIPRRVDHPHPRPLRIPGDEGPADPETQDETYGTRQATKKAHQLFGHFHFPGVPAARVGPPLGLVSPASVGGHPWRRNGFGGVPAFFTGAAREPLCFAGDRGGAGAESDQHGSLCRCAPSDVCGDVVGIPFLTVRAGLILGGHPCFVYDSYTYDPHHQRRKIIDQRPARLYRLCSACKIPLTSRSLVEETMSTDFSKLQRKVEQMPGDILHALEESDLFGNYHARPAYQQNDYMRWISHAKRQETRLKRINQMLDELQSGGIYMGMQHPPSRKLQS